MTPDTFVNWVAAIAVALCLLVGLAVAGVSIRQGMKAIAWSVVGYGVVGLLFMSAPKWTSLTLEFQGLKATVAKLNQENELLRRELADSGVSNAPVKAAEFSKKLAEFVSSAKPSEIVPGIVQAKSGVTYLDNLSSMAQRLGLEPIVLSRAVNAENARILWPVRVSELAAVDPSSLWIASNGIDQYFSGPATSTILEDASTTDTGDNHLSGFQHEYVVGESSSFEVGPGPKSLILGTRKLNPGHVELVLGASVHSLGVGERLALSPTLPTCSITLLGVANEKARLRVACS